MTTKAIPKIISKQIVVEGKESELPNEGIFVNNQHSLKFDYDGDISYPSKNFISKIYVIDGETIAYAPDNTPNVLFTRDSSVATGGSTLASYEDSSGLAADRRTDAQGITWDPDEDYPFIIPQNFENDAVYKLEVNCFFSYDDVGGASTTFQVLDQGGVNLLTCNVWNEGSGRVVPVSINLTIKNPKALRIQARTSDSSRGIYINKGTTINIYRFA